MSIKQQGGQGRKKKGTFKKGIKEQVLEQHRKSIKMSQHKKATLK